MDEEGGKDVMTHEEAIASQRTADRVACGFGFAFLAGGCVVAYWVWPAGVTDLTLAAITFGQVLRAIGSAVAVLVGLVLAAMFCS